MGRVGLPISDYVGDTKSALDNSLRVLQAIADIVADAGWLGTALATMHLIQSLMQVSKSFLYVELNLFHIRNAVFCSCTLCSRHQACH